MIKVLVVTYEFPPKVGGIGRYLFNLSSELSVNERFSLTLLTPEGQAQRCNRAEVKPLLGKGRVKDLYAISKTIRRGKFNIVIWAHSRTFLFAYLLSVLGRFMRYKSLIPLYGSELMKQRQGGAYSVYTERLFAASDALIPISLFTRSLIEENFQKKAHVLFPAIHDDWFDSEQTRQADPGQPMVFGTLSRLVKRKGHHRVLECMSKIKSDFEFKYFIAGDGPEMQHIKDMIKQYGLEDRVRLIGRVPEDHIIEFYDSIDAFIMLNSLEADDVEGFGYTFVEAGARGVASIGGKNGGAEEIIVDGKTGYLVNVMDNDDIISHIKYVLNNRDDWATLGENCKTVYRQAFGLKNMAKAYSNLIDKALESTT